MRQMLLMKAGLAGVSGFQIGRKTPDIPSGQNKRCS
jgi:hypothetical protein